MVGCGIQDLFSNREPFAKPCRIAAKIRTARPPVIPGTRRIPARTVEAPTASVAAENPGGPFCVRMAEGTQVKLKLVGIVLVATIGFTQQAPHSGELWRNLRNLLTGADGDRYFKQQLEGAELPRLDGKVVSQPSAHELIVNVDDPAGDARLQFC
jgi:hypothetical protein